MPSFERTITPATIHACDFWIENFVKKACFSYQVVSKQCKKVRVAVGRYAFKRSITVFVEWKIKNKKNLYQGGYK